MCLKGNKIIYSTVIRSWNEKRKSFFYFKDGKYYIFNPLNPKYSEQNSCIIGDCFDWNNPEPFIGISDKFGKELFSGDKVSVPIDLGPAGFSTFTIIVKWKDPIEGYQLGYWNISEAVLVGNIHEK